MFYYKRKERSKKNREERKEAVFFRNVNFTKDKERLQEMFQSKKD